MWLSPILPKDTGLGIELAPQEQRDFIFSMHCNVGLLLDINMQTYDIYKNWAYHRVHDALVKTMNINLLQYGCTFMKRFKENEIVYKPFDSCSLNRRHSFLCFGRTKFSTSCFEIGALLRFFWHVTCITDKDKSRFRNLTPPSQTLRLLSDHCLDCPILPKHPSPLSLKWEIYNSANFGYLNFIL